MELRFPESKISYWADQYLQYLSKNRVLESLYEKELTDENLVNNVKQQEYLDRELLKKVATWKSPRRAGLIDENSESYVREITGYALKSQDERVRWDILTQLKGIGHPTASAVLHLFHEAPYPIIDFRAMWSISVDEYNYSFEFWQKYVAFCRDLGDRLTCTKTSHTLVVGFIPLFPTESGIPRYSHSIVLGGFELIS